MKKLENLLLVMVVGASVGGCIDADTRDEPSRGSGRDEPGSPGSGGDGAPDAIVGGWRAPFRDGTSDRLDISKSLSGTALLYWYGYSWADWDVDVAVTGDDHVVTLRCPSDPDCVDAEPIVMTCEPLLDRMTCVASGGGYDDNYAGVTFDWKK